MNKLINIIGITVLCGILVKLSFVFFFLFDELDGGHIVGKITGVTFAFASVWFVVRVPSRWLKLTMVALDVSTILYYYLHRLWAMPIQYTAIIVAAYSGLIVFYIGSIVNGQLQAVHESETDRLRNELDRLRTENDLRRIENERKTCLRRIADSKTDSTRKVHEARLKELDGEYQKLSGENNQQGGMPPCQK